MIKAKSKSLYPEKGTHDTSTSTELIVKEEPFDVYDLSNSEVYDCPPVRYEELNQDSEFLINNGADVRENGQDTTEIANECMQVIPEDTKQTNDDDTYIFEYFKTDDDENDYGCDQTKNNLQNFNNMGGGENGTQKHLLDRDENFQVSNKKIKMEPNEESSCEEIEIKENWDKLANISENEQNAANNFAEDDDYDIQIEFEIEDGDGDVKNELIDIINKYTKTNSENSEQENLLTVKTAIKEEPIEENQSDDEEVLTVLEIISDDEHSSEEDMNVNEVDEKPTSLITINQTAPEQHVIIQKGTINEIEYCLSTTSQSSISYSQPASSKAAKNMNLSITELPDLTNLSVESKVEAFKYLYCLKKFFQSEQNEEPCRIISTIMMTFMCCGEPLKNKSS